jgi:hypothetical protein
LTSRQISRSNKSKITSSKCLPGLSPGALCRFNSYLSIKLNIR